MKSNSCEDRATVEPITLRDLALDAITLTPFGAMPRITDADYIKAYANILELTHDNRDLTPFINRPMMEKCAARVRELYKCLVAKHISYDYVYHTLKQEFGVELGVKPNRRR